MPYENMSDTNSVLQSSNLKLNSVSDTEYYEYLEDLKKSENTCK